MDSIRDALEKAKVAPRPPRPKDTFGRPPTPPKANEGTGLRAPGVGTHGRGPGGWAPPLLQLDPDHLERQRIVAASMTDPSHVAFNHLRTRVFHALKGNGWRTLAITSPTADCGKTVVAVNLAFALARQPNCRTVLIDLDLRRSSVARTVGVSAVGSIGAYLQGRAPCEACFVQVAENLTLGLNADRLKDASELMREQRLKDLFQFVLDRLAPDVILFDLPPMLATDDATAFLPMVDSGLLVVAAGLTTKPQVEECERHLVSHPGYMGVVLNKTQEAAAHYYYAGYHEGA